LQIDELFDSLLHHLVPVEECEERNVVMEMRAGAGGQWAADFNRELLEMYGRYCGRQGWRFEVS
jgi:peptide chain release factor 1